MHVCLPFLPEVSTHFPWIQEIFITKTFQSPQSCIPTQYKLSHETGLLVWEKGSLPIVRYPHHTCHTTLMTQDAFFSVL